MRSGFGWFLLVFSSLTLVAVAVDCTSTFKSFANGLDGTHIYGSTFDDLGDALLGVDLNKDGVNDVVTTCSSCSYVFVVWGHSGVWPSSISSYSRTNIGMMFSHTNSPSFASALAAADMNNDGTKDLILATTNTYYGSDSSTIYVFYARNDWHNTSTFDVDEDFNSTSFGFKIHGVSPNDQCGTSFAYIGDFNDDTRDDIAIGCPGTTSGGKSNAGRIYVLFGRASGFPLDVYLNNLTASEGFFFDGPISNGYLGNAKSISYAGDWNKDGYDDWMFGEQNAAIGSKYSAGRVSVIYGGKWGTGPYNLSDLDGTNGFVIPGTTSYENMGSYVSYLGDINGDGADDIAVYGDTMYMLFGISGFSNATLNVGTELNGTNGFKLSGTYRVAAIGDVNVDGIADFASSASYDYASVIYGRSQSWSANPSVSSLQAFEFGFDDATVVAGLGDVSGDGIPDFASAAPSWIDDCVIVGFGMPSWNIPHCGNCHSWGCEACDDGYGMYNKGTAGINCTLCSTLGPNMYSTGKEECKSCVENHCLTCNAYYGYCTECQFGWGIDYSKDYPLCHNCTIGKQYNWYEGTQCINCDVSSDCLSCDMRHGYCAECPPGTAPDAYGCKNCSTNQFTNGINMCQDCELLNGCLSCDKITGHCTKCPTGLVPYATGCVQSNCVPCPVCPGNDHTSTVNPAGIAMALAAPLAVLLALLQLS